MYMQRVNGCCLQKSEEDVGCPGTGFIDGCNLHVGAGTEPESS